MSRMPILQRCVYVSNSYHVHDSDALSCSHLLQLKSESFYCYIRRPVTSSCWHWCGI